MTLMIIIKIQISNHLYIFCCRPHVVALILARGGSKGIPRKNLALIQNTTLLRRSLDTINDCRCMINIMLINFFFFFNGIKMELMEFIL
jgi:hypothetical protein